MTVGVARGLYSDVIRERWRRPKFRGELPGANRVAEDVNPLCGDRVRLMLSVQDERVTAARFIGDSCAICAASADVLAELLQPVVALRYFMAGSTNDGAKTSKELARAYVERSRHELLELRAQDLEAQTELLLQRWDHLRPMEMADAVAALKVEESHAA